MTDAATANSDLAFRFKDNPLLVPDQVTPSDENLHVECLLNPGVFRFENKIWLLLRVAEAAKQDDKLFRIPVLRDNQLDTVEIAKSDPAVDTSDPRVVIYNGKGYLTTLSHLRLAYSKDGRNFTVTDRVISGQGPLESYGVEDCRVTQIEDTYYLTYTAVSQYGTGVGMITTTDWENFTRHGMIISGPNKDCAIFEQKIAGKYYCLHRPSMSALGGNDLWLAESFDLIHWGNHRCLATTRAGMWDSQRIGAGAAPIETPRGWLEMYHGANENHRYCLGALLLDKHDPGKVLARSRKPIMQPLMDYEKAGFFGNVIFTNGHIVDYDQNEVVIYYGAADSVICGAKFNIENILDSLERCE